ncbi:MAG: PEP-CTERM sorting domain-containing protein [Desulfobacteraceae bacterium]|nr:PEP-CTERM sorting domain-containing protein [Desulfobacteraceae bacterium]
MKKKLLAGLAIGVMMFGMTGMASADTIVDTGTNQAGSNWTLSNSQWLAGQFSLSQAYTITDVEGFMWGGSGSTATVALYTDGGTVPVTELFSKQFTAGTDASHDWYGASGLSWALAAGTYWASFEVRAGDTYWGSLTGSALHPLGKEAYHPLNSLGWVNYDNLNLAVRISGDTGNNPVPEPATMLLMGTGLAGLIGARRKNKK